jgi:hypothetical protein
MPCYPPDHIDTRTVDEHDILVCLMHKRTCIRLTNIALQFDTTSTRHADQVEKALLAYDLTKTGCGALDATTRCYINLHPNSHMTHQPQLMLNSVKLSPQQA